MILNKNSYFIINKKIQVLSYKSPSPIYYPLSYFLCFIEFNIYLVYFILLAISESAV